MNTSPGTAPTETATGYARPASAMGIDEVGRVAELVIRNVETVIDGKRDAVRSALMVLMAEGHLLIEDVPGVGKTMLAKALARSVDCTVGRIQFTPDLLPSDVTGVAVFDQSSRKFEFNPGPVFANIVIGDEINRASPKTQSALLECMEERQVTVDGTSHRLSEPFVVIATQNPIEMEGTYPLPEAQRDRFMARVSMGYPAAKDEVAMLDARETTTPLERISAVVSEAGLREMIRAVRQVFASQPVKEYAVALANATREDRRLRLGASPRATLQLIRSSKARAAIEGRDFVIPDDLDALAVPVLAHRIVPTSRALGSHDHEGGPLVEAIIRQIVEETPVPVGAQRRG